MSGNAFGYQSSYQPVGGQIGTPGGAQEKAFGLSLDQMSGKAKKKNPYGGVGERFAQGDEVAREMRQQGQLFSQDTNPFANIAERTGDLSFNFGEGGPIDHISPQKVEGIGSDTELARARQNALGPLNKVFNVFGETGTEIGELGMGSVLGNRFQLHGDPRVAEVSRKQAQDLRALFPSDPTNTLRGAFDEASGRLIDRGLFDERDSAGLQGLYSNVLNSFERYGLL